MIIDYGKIIWYSKERGIGHVSHLFREVRYGDALFQIGILKSFRPDVFRDLENLTNLDQWYIWYGYDITPEGQNVVAIPNFQEERTRRKLAKQIAAFMPKIEGAWANVEEPLPEWFKRATVELLTEDEVLGLASCRDTLLAEKRRLIEEQRRVELAKLQETRDKREAEQRANAVRLYPFAVQLTDEQREEEEEFRLLIEEMSPLGFTHSEQVSRYIVNYELGYKYRSIAGILRMRQNGRFWYFNGGIAPRVYARLCEVLGLCNSGSDAEPEVFVPFKDLHGR